MDNSDDDISLLAELCARLRKARDYQRGRDRSHDKDAVHGGRLAAIVALDAVLDFLEHVPSVRQDKLHEPLRPSRWSGTITLAGVRLRHP